MNTATALVQPQGTQTVARLRFAVLPSFDLERVVARVSKEHPDWSQDRLQAAEDAYRVFLAKAKSYPCKKHIPSLDADEMWHGHILHTKNYMQDCMAYFGFFFHHEPTDQKAHQVKSLTGDCCGDCHGGTCTGCCNQIHAADCSGCEGTSCLGHD